MPCNGFLSHDWRRVLSVSVMHVLTSWSNIYNHTNPVWWCWAAIRWLLIIPIPLNSVSQSSIYILSLVFQTFTIYVFFLQCPRSHFPRLVFLIFQSHGIRCLIGNISIIFLYFKVEWTPIYFSDGWQRHSYLHWSVTQDISPSPTFFHKVLLTFELRNTNFLLLIQRSCT